MKYSFRRGPITGDEKIEITSSAVKYFKGQGPARREISLADIQEIHGFSNMSAFNEQGERFATHMIKLVPKRGRSIVVGSSSFIQHGTGHRQIAKDHADQYIQVMSEIKTRVADSNPDAVLVDGNLAASIGGYTCALLGLGLLVMVVFASLFSRKPISSSWPLLLLGGGLGLLLIPWGIGMGSSYWPERILLAETMHRVDETVSDA